MADGSVSRHVQMAFRKDYEDFMLPTRRFNVVYTHKSSRKLDGVLTVNQKNKSLQLVDENNKVIVLIQEASS